jgi:hypothetical protein
MKKERSDRREISDSYVAEFEDNLLNLPAIHKGI